MPTQLVFIIVTAVVGGLLLLGAVLAVLRERRPRTLGDETSASAGGKYDADTEEEAAALRQAGAGGGVLRVIWWVMVAGVLIAVGLSGAYTQNQTPIYAVGAVAVVAVVVLHELLPSSWRTPVIGWLEVVIAFSLAASLLLLTGYGGSPFVFTLYLIAVAIALAGNEWAALGGAVVATAAYLGVIALDPGPGFATGRLLQVALSVGAIWLLTLLAAVFARNERRTRRMLSRLSRIDPLTGLLNRGQLYQTLEQEVRRTRRSDRGFSLLMMDLDGLKAVNDGLGHQRGDEVLRDLGRVIRDDIRNVDSAYRYGGDEFLVLLPETDFSGAFVVAEKIRSDAEDLGLSMEAEGISTSVSIGLVSHPEDGGTAEELVRAADRAMYNAKSLGKNQISGYPRPLRLPPPLTFTPPEEGPAEPLSRGHGAPSSPPAAASASTGDPAPAAFDAEDASKVAPAPVLEVAERWVAVPDPEPRVAAIPVEGSEEDEPTAAEVRRRMAVASRSFDPDHQIRAAMDAFLSPPDQSVRRPD